MLATLNKLCNVTNAYLLKGRRYFDVQSKKEIVTIVNMSCKSLKPSAVRG